MKIGKRGIGKSAFLRFFCDSVNHKLNRLNKNKRKRLKIGKGIAIYIELSSYGNTSIVEQIFKNSFHIFIYSFTAKT